MRSATPKLLHEVCGRAMIAWPVAAARAAGAAQGDRGRGSRPAARGVAERPGDGGDAGRSRAARPTRSRRRRGHIDPDDTVIVLNGDHPLITAETLGRAGRGARRTRARRRRWRPRCSRTRAATGGSCGRRTERSSAWSRRRRPGDATELELHIREISTGHLRVRGRGAAGGARGGPERQRAGRALPARRAADPARARAQRAARTRSTTPASWESTIGSRLADGQGDRAAPHPRAPHARGRDDRRSGHDRDRRRRADRPGHGDRARSRACTAPPRSATARRIGPRRTLIDSRVGDGVELVHSYSKERGRR